MEKPKIAMYWCASCGTKKARDALETLLTPPYAR